MEGGSLCDLTQTISRSKGHRWKQILPGSEDANLLAREDHEMIRLETTNGTRFDERHRVKDDFPRPVFVVQIGGYAVSF